MPIKKYKPLSPDPYVGKIKGDTEFARLAHINDLVDQVNNNAPTPPISSYKVYTALLTQSGDSNVLEKVQGDTLVLGVTYFIFINEDNVDLTVFGAPDSNEGTYFVCTQVGNLPGAVNISLQYDTGAPVVTVLENTIGNVWWSYHNQGIYKADCTGGFTIDKTVFFSNPSAYYADNVIETDVTSTSVYLNSYGLTNSAYENDLLYKTPIEIRVYN